MKNLIVISDFDGTIVVYDIFEKILDEYTKEDWRIYDYLADENKIKLEEAILKQFSFISHLSDEEILEFSKKFLVERENASTFIKFCNENSIDLVIASAGLSIYINYFFNKIQAKAKIFCLEVKRINNKLEGRLPIFEGNHANFKEAIVKNFKKDDNFIIYIGDGFNDFYPAIQSNITFAVEGSVLDSKLSKAKIEYKKFVNFSTIINYIKNLKK